MKISPILLSLLAFAAFGCTPEEEQAADPDMGVLTGEVDKALAGEYKAGGGMIYSFKEDGSFTLKGQVNTPGGMVDRESEGEWRVDGDKLMIKDAQGYVVPYLLKKEGTTLKLTMTGSMKSETTLTPMEESPAE